MNLQYKELTDRAYYYHSHNNLEKAEELYNQLLIINPDDANVLNLYGLLCLSLGKIQNALRALSKAYVLEKNSYIASNLAKAYYMNSEINKAIKIYNQALELNENDDIYYSLGLAYKKSGNYEKLIECYKKAVEINPKNYNALYNLSLACKDINDINQAIFYAKKCLDIKQDDDVYGLLSGFYEDTGDINSSIEALKSAILLNNKNYLYFYNLGVLYSRIGKKDEAERFYLKTIELNSSYIDSYINLAALYRNKDNEKAILYLKKAYEINPCNENLLLNLAKAYRDLYNNDESINILNELLAVNKNSDEGYSLCAMNYMDTGKYSKALDYYNKAVELNPDNYNFLHGKAIALKYLGRINEAKEILEYIVNKDKTAIQSATALGMMYLANKEFEKGMKLYSLRSSESKFKDVFKDRIWTFPQSLDNKDVLVYTDCGLGDTVMFSRFLPILKDRAKSLTLQTDKELVSLLKNSFDNINVIRKSVIPPHYDVVISIMDLQYALNIDFSMVSSKPYIKADFNKVKIISETEIIKNKKNKTGLFWQGNKRIFKNRSIEFSLIEKLLLNDNCTFYSFQIGTDSKKNENIYELKEYINDYSDTAAILKNMDILITIDSSIAHAAGALGIKTFLLLPYTPEWRWFNDNKTTIWYDSVRIFKQNKIGKWDDVIEQVSNELNKI